ncbi:DNA-binding NarL/FixJ family response regulator [Prosthecobacter vanneervenii]|uniref:DNA-binding NarL/FixJ family response regulator n=2 Tax=Prosthecobacter vanneervenii TaxID=48466 RepID=A0A7W7Y8A4_9BACT|nr:DNA-binding NarL/FixJ family response regulator [Prosthecobacter vanneervenii]
MFREIMIPLLEREFPGYTFITASSIKEATPLLEHHAFDLLITDISGLESPWLSMILQARDQSPGTKAIILTSEMSSFWVHRAIREGVLGIVTKTCPVSELVCAIHSVVEGGKHLSPEIAQKFMQHISYSQIGNPMNLLSPRELEIFVQIGHGRRLKSIAKELGLSPCTVAVHKHNIARKTGIITSANIARYCLEHGMLGLKPEQTLLRSPTAEPEAAAA